MSLRLVGKYVVFSGFRSEPLKAQIIAKGGNVLNNLTSRANILVVVDQATIDKNMSKVKEAKERNIPIYTLETFEKTYVLPKGALVTRTPKVFIKRFPEKLENIAHAQAKINEQFVHGDIIYSRSPETLDDAAYYIDLENNTFVFKKLDGDTFFHIPKRSSTHINDIKGYYGKAVVDFYEASGISIGIEVSRSHDLIKHLTKSLGASVKTMISYNGAWLMAVVDNDRVLYFDLEKTTIKQVNEGMNTCTLLVYTHFNMYLDAPLQYTQVDSPPTKTFSLTKNDYINKIAPSKNWSFEQYIDDFDNKPSQSKIVASGPINEVDRFRKAFSMFLIKISV